MKAIVASLPPSCEILPEDVDLLPWSGGGFALNVKKMNQLFYEPEDKETK
jgi:hypothetical protein